MNELFELICEKKLVIIARGVPANVLVNAATALADAGIRMIESTFDHSLKDPIADNVEKVSALRKALGTRIRVGAGTVLTPDEAKAACDAGAEYIIAPNTNPRVIETTKKLGLLSIPGAMTPSEICAAWDMGADMIKLFPADDLGMHYLQNLRGPLPHIPIMVTGGVNPDSIPLFLRYGAQAMGTGITVLRPDLVQKRDYAGMAALAKEHIEAIAQAERA